MRQRLALRRILLQRLSTPRPQLPFLTIPVTNRPRARYFTTEKKRWLRWEGSLFLRYNISIWGGAACVLAIVFLLNQEALEKEFPTPHEWSIRTRMWIRGAKSAAVNPHLRNVDWAEVIISCREALNILEDVQRDGKGIRELLDEPLSIDGLGAAGKDVSAQPRARSGGGDITRF
uniref:Uncharacterized protein n=1 Tax=Colletotrichum fructicola (strain Nara gc5) TaxID=1213859 RepID=L2FVZ0_COLFN